MTNMSLRCNNHGACIDGNNTAMTGNVKEAQWASDRERAA